MTSEQRIARVAGCKEDQIVGDMRIGF